MKRYYNTKGSAERIRQLRKRSHITQSMLAEQAIADVYDVSLDYLVGCEDAAR